MKWCQILFLKLPHLYYLNLTLEVHLIDILKNPFALLTFLAASFLVLNVKVTRLKKLVLIIGHFMMTSLKLKWKGEVHGDLGAFSLDEFRELIQNKISQSLLKF